MPADVEVAAMVEVEPMTPEAGVHVPDVQVVTMQVNVPTVKMMTMDVNVPAQMDMTAVTMDMTDAMGTMRHVGTVHAVAAMTADAVMATTAAAMRARIGSTGGEGSDADNGRRDEGEESRTFEHCRRPFGSVWAIRDIGRSIHASGSSD